MATVLALPTLAALEAVVERGLATFVEVGLALLEIRERRLFEEAGYTTFTDYCKCRWGFSDSRGRQLVAAAETVTTVTAGGLPPPSSERVARELAPLAREDPEAAREVWEEVSGNGEPTAEKVRQAVDRRLHNIRVLTSSESPEYYTPRPYVDAVRDVLGGIDIDPASSAVAQETVRAGTFYTTEDDGLAKDWPGRVFLNPPYGALAPRFVARLMEQYEAGVTNAAIVLLNAHATDTKWFRPLWEHTLCFTDHRIDYNSPEGKRTASTHGSVFVYLGLNRARFAEVFSQFGPVVHRLDGGCA